MNKHTESLLNEAKKKKRKSCKLKQDTNSLHLLESHSTRKYFVTHTARKVVRDHKRTMEILADL
ncbi:hypothetical protein C1T06_23000 [Vibrio parahaemolyticus]|nr:hypothetical protein C1T06_23000 [Vibrio parahaemolyticus]